MKDGRAQRGANGGVPTLGEPRFGKIDHATRVFGPSRATWYRLASKHPGLMVKLGRATLIDFTVADAIMRDLPPATLRGAK